MIPADSVIVCNSQVFSSESALTGEPEDLRKSKLKGINCDKIVIIVMRS